MARWEPDARGRLLQAAVSLFAERGYEATTIEDIARDLGVGRRTLERHFLSDLRQSPLRIYAELRIERALLRLRSTADSTTEIALACGFCDAPHLTRVLKTERGITPAQYRRLHAGSAIMEGGNGQVVGAGIKERRPDGAAQAPP